MAGHTVVSPRWDGIEGLQLVVGWLFIHSLVGLADRFWLRGRLGSFVVLHDDG